MVAAEERRGAGDVLGGRHAFQRRAIDERLPLLLDADAAYFRLSGDDAIDAIA